MERWVVVLFAALTGLGIGLMLFGQKRSRTVPGRDRDEMQPWRAVPLPTIAAGFTLTAVLTLGTLALAGPILAAAAGSLLFEVTILVLQGLRRRRERQIHDEALVLVDTLLTETTMGAPLPDALRVYTQRHGKAHLAEEVQVFLLHPLAGGESLVDVLNRLTDSPRYRPYPTFHRLLLHLARAARARLAPEETEHALRAFLDTAEMVDEVERELAVDVTQTRYTRWAVVGIICGGIALMAFIMPDARHHWLHDLVGQVTMLLVSFFIALAVGLGESLARLKDWRF